MGQGYYFGKPVDATATLRYLAENHHDFALVDRASA